MGREGAADAANVRGTMYDVRFGNSAATPQEVAERRAQMERLGGRMPGYRAFVLGEWEKHPERREVAVKVFGEEFVKEWEEADEWARDKMLGRAWCNDVKRADETEEDYLVRRSRVENCPVMGGYNDLMILWQRDREKMKPLMEKEEREQKENEAASARFMIGDELDDKTQGVASRALASVGRARAAKMEAMRAWSEKYLVPLSKLDDGEEMLRRLDGLREEVFEFIADDPDRAELMKGTLLEFGERVSESDVVSGGDEFVVALGKVLSNWYDFLNKEGVREMAVAAGMEAGGVLTPVGGGVITPTAMRRTEGMYRDEKEALADQSRAAREYGKYRMSAAYLRDAVNRSLELGKNTGFWEGAYRTTVRWG